MINNLPKIGKNESLANYAYRLSLIYSENISINNQREKGQVFTPIKISSFMAKICDIQELDNISILDPGAGTGVLLASIVDRFIQLDKMNSIKINIDCYEIDSNLCYYLQQTLIECRKRLKAINCEMNFHIYNEDFILKYQFLLKKDYTLFPSKKTNYDFIISNPPYFKIKRKSSPYSNIIDDMICGSPNIYVLFMAVSVKLLKNNGQAIFITPRSFCSGLYFQKFLKWFLNNSKLLHIHLFESRNELFLDADILQENIILKVGNFPDNSMSSKDNIIISSSFNGDFGDYKELNVSITNLIFQKDDFVYLRLPISKIDMEVLKIIDNWSFTLHTLGMEISTGPVIANQIKRHLVNNLPVNNQVPIIWLHNLQNRKVLYPYLKNQKALSMLINEKTKQWLLPTQNYVLLRRFSSKEQHRRLYAAVLNKEQFRNYSHIGIENHVNYIWKRNSELTNQEAYGLSLILNSIFLDTYFRALNGNTQVNASEIRNVPLPSLSKIETLGSMVYEKEFNDELELNLQIAEILGINNQVIHELYERYQIKMSKIDEALDILMQIKMPKQQLNERSALTLLALLNLKEADDWKIANKSLLRIHDIIEFIEISYKKIYAENSRETIRRQTIHQFEFAGIVIKNPDDPKRSTNSPNTVYSITDEFLKLVKCYNSDEWENELLVFTDIKGTLSAKYQNVKQKIKIPLKIEGVSLELSPGKHNELQVHVIQKMIPRFLPNSKLLYVGDTSDKLLYYKEELLKKIGIPLTQHDKLPDLVYYDDERASLILIEAVTSHGPVSAKRQLEIEDVLKDCSLNRIYITAFPDKRVFKKYLDDIAWETEVWIASQPDHMIHFNGPKFLFTLENKKGRN